MPFFTHNVEDMLNDELKPNFGDWLRTSANLSAQGRSQGGGHRGQSLPLRPVGLSGQSFKNLLPVGPSRGPQSDPLGSFFIFCKPGTRVKAACRTKRGPSQNFRTLFLSFIDPFSSGVGSLMLLGALKHELSPLRSKMGPLNLIFFAIFTFNYFFLVRDFGPSPKKIVNQIR